MAPRENPGDPTPVDGELEGAIARARAGDRQAADRLLEACGARLKAFVERRIGPRLATHVTVDDVVQETCLRALRSLDGFTGEERSFLRWLKSIAENVVLEAVRGERRRRYLSLDFDLSGSTVSPTSRLQREERKARLDRALASLSPEHVQVITLVRLEGRSVNEAARLLERTPNATSQLLIRALAKLRQAFGETGSFTLPEPGPDRGERESHGSTG